METKTLLGLYVCLLLAPTGGFADIGLTLRNGGGRTKGGSAYLPPRTTTLPEPTQNTFKESNYGNSQYQIFEVHNSFTNAGAAQTTNYPGGPEYLPPVREQKLRENIVDNLDLSLLGITAGPGEKIRIEHVHTAPASTPPAPVPVAAPAVAATVPAPTIPIPFPSNYQHDFQKKKVSSQSTVQRQIVDQVNQGVVEEPRPVTYLPPQREEAEKQIIYQSQQQQQQQEFDNSIQSQDVQTAYQQQQPQQQQQAQQQTYQQQQQDQYQSAYKGPDYLPPHKESTVATPTISTYPQQQYTSTVTTFKGPDYLPPHQQQLNTVAPVESREYQAPEYLPPTSATTQQSHESYEQQQYVQSPLTSASPVTTTTEYRAPGYLPPGYDYPNPEDQQQQQQPRIQSTVATSTSTASGAEDYRAPEYLPPGYDQSNGQQQVQQVSSGALNQISQQVYQQDLPQQAAPNHPTQSAPISLPHGYDFNKPANAEQAIAELHSLNQQEQVTTGYSSSQQQQVTTGYSSSQQQPQQQHQDVVVQTQIQVAGREIAEDIVYGQPIQELNHQVVNNQVVNNQGVNNQAQFQGNEYLPPQHGQQQQQQTPQPQPHYQAIQQTQSYRAPDYLPPTTTATVTNTNTNTNQQQQNLHSLSSYMTAVQPYERYAQSSRKPFAQYGPPQQQQQQQQKAAVPAPSSQPIVFPQPAISNELPSMYREKAKRPTYYAPGMSYLKNPASYPTITYSSSLSAQAKETLQKFMPKDVQEQLQQQQQQQQPQQQQVSAAPTVASPTGKVRTVQIINTNAVRTLKVLETLDHAGVKTIKILGTSQEHPMGDHHVVKVVTQNGHNANEHVQTVKIFNDQKDFQLPAMAATVATSTAASVAEVGATLSTTGTNNGYLPPFRSRVARESWLRKKQRQANGKLNSGRPRR